MTRTWKPGDLVQGGEKRAWQLVRRLGAGGMGEVWAARETGAVGGGDVALKFLHPCAATDHEALVRLGREAVVGRRLSGRHTVRVHRLEAVAGDGAPFLVMELLRGTNLKDVLRAEGTLSIRRALAIVRQLLEGLVELHAAGVVHRDVKPANVFLHSADDGTETVKLLDFGVVTAPSGADSFATRTGATPGTVRYMAPEQVLGQRTDARTDLFAAGIVLYELLTGRWPWNVPADAPDVARGVAIASTPAARLGARGGPPAVLFPESLERFVARLLARAPADRPADAPAAIAELTALERALDDGDSFVGFVLDPGDDSDLLFGADVPSLDDWFPGDSGARIKVFGVGRTGSAVVELVVHGPAGALPTVLVTTDPRTARTSRAAVTVLIDDERGRGLGAGGDPEWARSAAERGAPGLRRELAGCDLVLLTAGLGGGTGSGAAPVLARLAREQGIPVLAVVSLPFAFEGRRRTRVADTSLARLLAECDAVVPIPGDRVAALLDARTPVTAAFGTLTALHERALAAVDALVRQAGMVNVDFADLMAAFRGAGRAAIGVGSAAGPDAVIAAVREAVTTGYLSETPLCTAQHALLLVEGGPGLQMAALAAGAHTLEAACDPDVSLVFGASVVPERGDSVQATLFATRFATRFA